MELNEDLDLEKLEDFNLKWTMEGLFKWLRSIPFYIGLMRGLELAKQPNIYTSSLYHPGDFKGFEFYWTHYYSSTYVCFSTKETEFWHYDLGHEWNRFCVKGREDILKQDFKLFLCTKIDITILKFLPGIVQRNGIRPCSICSPANGNGLLLLPICIPIGDKWICKECQDRYSLPPPGSIEDEVKEKVNSFTAEQRAKMTAALRYSILERDGFKCVVCGRSPLQGDNVTLEVDHIKPIFKGGLTKPDNLQTLCKDCNRGKGVKDFWTEPRPQRRREVKGQWFGEKI